MEAILSKQDLAALLWLFKFPFATFFIQVLTTPIPPSSLQAGRKKLGSTALVLGREGGMMQGEREQINTQRETISHYKMSCQGTFGKYCYWGARKRKQILSVTSEEKGVRMKEVLQKGISVQKWQLCLG